MDRHLFDKWIDVAEQQAGLAKSDGSLWHAYRRKRAIERKHLPLKIVAAAGGGKNVNTLLGIYQLPDEGSVLAVMTETRKLLRKRGQPDRIQGIRHPKRHLRIKKKTPQA